MEEKRTYLVIGGDARQKYLAQLLQKDGYDVHTCALLQEDDVPLQLGLQQCTDVVLPLPVSRDGKTVNAPQGAEPIFINDLLARQLQGKAVYGGMCGRLYAAGEIWNRVAPLDYYTEEAFLIANAQLTAEGAIWLAMQHYPGAIRGARCLVVGYGRIGRLLSALLVQMHAQVTCCARKPADLAYITAGGCTAMPTQNVQGEYDLIFNTVPYIIFTQERLAGMDGTPLYFELASAPGGIDLAQAGARGIPVIDGASLPGRYAPLAAAQQILQAIRRLQQND